MYVQDDLEHAVMGSPDHPIVCIAQDSRGRDRRDRDFDLFEQKKKRLTKWITKLFSMMAGHAATAIFQRDALCRSQRTLSTIKGSSG
jgi:hypothetical protein